MTRPVRPQLPDVPESTVSELHALYHENTGAEPGSLLDRRILDAARAELLADRSRKVRRPMPWWKHWLAPTSAIAVAVVGLSLGWRVMDEQERDARQEMSSKSQAADAAAGKLVAPERPTEAQPSIKAQASTPQRDEAKASRNVTSAAQAPAAKPAPASEAQAFPAAPALAAPAPPPVPAQESLKKSARADADELREKRETGDAVTAGSTPAFRQGRIEAAPLGSSAAANAAAKSVDDAATPEAWLQHIRQLRAAGRNPEALQSLARFRARYPDQLLPDDLINLK